MKRQFLLFTSFLLCLILSGCGDASAKDNMTGLSVAKDGKVTQTIVESFDKGFYDVSELATQIQQEVDAYNSENGEGHITAKDPGVENGIVRVSLTYQDYNDYDRFNNRALYIGTVEEAIDRGYSFQVAIKSVEDDTILNADNIKEASDYHIVVVDEPGIVRLFNRILYVSDGVTVTDKKVAEVSQDMEGLCYIIFQ